MCGPNASVVAETILLGLARSPMSAQTEMAIAGLGMSLMWVMRSLALDSDDAEVYVMTTYRDQPVSVGVVLEPSSRTLAPLLARSRTIEAPRPLADPVGVRMLIEFGRRTYLSQLRLSLPASEQVADSSRRGQIPTRQDDVQMKCDKSLRT